INVGQVITPSDAMTLVPANAPDYVRAEIRSGLAAAKLGFQGYFDNWGGFPAARSRLLKAAQAADADLIVLSGDSHNGWAFEFAEDGRPAGVEFGGHSVTSPGYETYLTGATPETVARSLVASSPELKWADTSGRGYMAIELSPERVTGEWVMMEGIRTRSLSTRDSHRMSVERGRRVFSS
ncbi:MAG: alkaline phosphatase D family protein, partial [Sphingomonadaceae bacterium]